MNTSTLSPINRKNWLTPNRACNIIWVLLMTVGFAIAALFFAADIISLGIASLILTLVGAPKYISKLHPIVFEEKTKKFFSPNNVEIKNTSVSPWRFLLGFVLMFSSILIIGDSVDRLFNSPVVNFIFAWFCIFSILASFYSFKDQPISLLFSKGMWQGEPLTPEEFAAWQQNQRHHGSIHPHNSSTTSSNRPSTSCDPAYSSMGSNIYNHLRR